MLRIPVSVWIVDDISRDDKVVYLFADMAYKMVTSAMGAFQQDKEQICILDSNHVFGFVIH